MKRALLALAAVLCAACTTTVPSGPITPADVTPSAASPSATASSPSCDASLWNHVYHPDRLKVIEACKTVTGTVDAVRLEPDGDTHIDLHVADPALVNAANVRYQHGDLVLEQICQGTVTQADAIAACQNVPHNQVIPHVGDQVTVTGTYVLDQVHGWLEIHPVSDMGVR